MKTVIFDCDGTLVDSEVLTNEVLVEAAAEHGLVVSVDDAVRAFRGGKMADCVAQLEARLGRPLPADFVPHFGPYRDCISIQAAPGRWRPGTGSVRVRPSLRGLERADEKIELSLSLTGLLPFFEAFSAVTTWHHGNPTRVSFMRRESWG